MGTGWLPVMFRGQEVAAETQAAPEGKAETDAESQRRSRDRRPRGYARCRVSMVPRPAGRGFLNRPTRAFSRRPETVIESRTCGTADIRRSAQGFPCFGERRLGPVLSLLPRDAPVVRTASSNQSLNFLTFSIWRSLVR